MKPTISVSRPYQNRTNSVSSPYQVQAYRHGAGTKLLWIRQRVDKTLIMSACKVEYKEEQTPHSSEEVKKLGKVLYPLA